MSQSDPQPTRPTQAQIDAAYRDGLFGCEIEWNYVSPRESCKVMTKAYPARIIPGYEARWIVHPKSLDAYPESVEACGYGDALSNRDVMIFPWGRVPVREWTGWPRVEWALIARLQTWHRPEEAPSMRAEDWQHGWATKRYDKDKDGPTNRLRDAGFWSASRAIAYPDEATLARAAWADPSCYAIYADWCDEQGHELLAKALRRVCELTAGAPSAG